MLKAMCEDFSFILVRNRIISEDDREVYTYGLELIVNSLLIIGSIILLGILFNQLLITVTFLIVFWSLRSHTGGYHADQYWKCYCVGCLTYLSIIGLVDRIPKDYRNFWFFMILTISYIVIFGIAPLNSERTPKTQQEMRKNGVTAKVLVSLYTIIAAIGILVYPSAGSLWFTIAFTQLVVAIFLMVTQLQRRYLR